MLKSKLLTLLFFLFSFHFSVAQIYPASFLLESQADVDNAVEILSTGNYTGVEGFLWIGTLNEFETPAVIWDLSGLEMLKSVGTLAIQNTDSLVNLQGLHNIDTCYNTSFRIVNNQDLISIVALENSVFPNLGDGLDKNLRIMGNNSLINLDGLEGITAVGYQLRVLDNEMLEDLNGLRNLKEIGDFLFVHLAKGNSLSGLDSLRGGFSFSLSRSPFLTDIKAVQSWESLASLTIGTCEQLTDLSPLRELLFSKNSNTTSENLSVLFIIDCPSVTELPLLSFDNDDAASIHLENMPALTNIDSIKHLQIIRRLEINNCDALTDFEMPNLYRGTRLFVENNDLLTDFDFPPYSDVVRSFDRFECRINNNPVMKEIIGAGTLEKLDILEINDNTNLERIGGFNTLDTIFSYFDLGGSTAMKSLRGFEQLRVVGDGEESINQTRLMVGLSNIDTIEAFENIETVFGSIGFYGSGYTSLPSFDQLKFVGSEIGVGGADLPRLEIFNQLKKLGGTIILTNMDQIDSIFIGQQIDSTFLGDDYNIVSISRMPNLKYVDGYNSNNIFTGKKIRIRDCPALDSAPIICNIKNYLGPSLEYTLFDTNSEAFQTEAAIDAHCQTVSTLDFNEIDLVVYPNPFVHTLNVKLPTGHYFSQLSDLNGRLIITQQMDAEENTMELSNLKNGIYFLTIRDEQERVVGRRKVVKMGT